MSTNPDRGSGKLGCIIILLILAATIFLSMKAGPVYLAKVNFQDDLNSITSKAGVYNWTEKKISREVLTAAESYGFAVTSDGIRVVRRNLYQQAPRIEVNVTLSKPVDFAGYIHEFRFEAKSTGLIGSL